MAAGQGHDIEFDARLDQDVFSGSVCHPELGFHKHGPAHRWDGVVIGLPLRGDEVVATVIGSPFGHHEE